MEDNRTGKTEHIGKHLPNPGNIPDYNHIQLTPEETERALRFARMLKASEQEDAEKKRKRALAIQEAMAPWTTDELTRHILDRAKILPFRFEIDDDNRNIFQLLCLYFSNNPDFENHGHRNDKGEIVQQYSLAKGICLHSQERGTGKTILMELFNQNKKNSFAVISTAKISSFFEADGDKVISRFSQPWACERDPKFFYQSPVGICFDDLGDEEIKNHYGNRENVMNRILTRIYSENPEKSVFPFFHATTNLTGPELEEKYDKRVRSRMREMFNWIVLSGKDRRK